MEKTTSQLATLQRNGHDLWGLHTLIGGGSFALRRLNAVERSSGWTATFGSEPSVPPTIAEWPTYGFTEENLQVYLCVDPITPHQTPHTFQPLVDILAGDRESAVGRFRDLVRTLAAVFERLPDSARMHGHGVLFGPQTLAIIAPDLMNHTREYQVPADQLRLYEPFNHPDLRGADNLSFALAVLAYRIYVGSMPFSGADAGEIRARIRQQLFVAPEVAQPELDGELCAFIKRALTTRAQPVQAGKSPVVAGPNDRNRPAPTIDEWVALVDRLSRDGYTHSVAAATLADLRTKAAEQAGRLEAGFRRREFVRKYWKTALVGAAVAVVALSIPFSMLMNALKPRETAGFSPEAVIEAFYMGFNDFNHQIMEDAVIDGAGQGEINEVTNLYVMSRMRMSVEMTSPYLDAQWWVDNDKPDLIPGVEPYGTANLVIVADAEQTRAIGNPVFMVALEKWGPDFDGEIDYESLDVQAPRSGVRYKEQRVYLRQDGEDWVIYQIDYLYDAPEPRDA